MKLKIKKKYKRNKLKKMLKKTYKKKNHSRKIKKYNKNKTKNKRRRSKKYVGGSQSQSTDCSFDLKENKNYEIENNPDLKKDIGNKYSSKVYQVSNIYNQTIVPMGHESHEKNKLNTFNNHQYCPECFTFKKDNLSVENILDWGISQYCDKGMMTIDMVLNLFENLKVTDPIMVKDYVWTTKASLNRPGAKVTMQMGLKEALKDRNDKHIILLCAKKNAGDDLITTRGVRLNPNDVNNVLKKTLSVLFKKSKARGRRPTGRSAGSYKSAYKYNVTDFQTNCMKYFGLNTSRFKTALKTYFNSNNNQTSHSGGSSSNTSTIKETFKNCITTMGDKQRLYDDIIRKLESDHDI